MRKPNPQFVGKIDIDFDKILETHGYMGVQLPNLVREVRLLREVLKESNLLIRVKKELDEETDVGRKARLVEKLIEKVGDLEESVYWYDVRTTEVVET